MTSLETFLVVILVALIAVNVTALHQQGRQKEPEPESKTESQRFREGMAKLGFKDWEIEEELDKIESEDRLKLINEEMEKSILKHNL